MTQPIQQPAERPRPWLAAVAVAPILATVFQTFVLTDVTDDVIRKGLEAEHYTMIWPQVLWGIGLLYGVFTGIWASSRHGARDTLLAGLGLFAVGNVLCGAALDVPGMTVARLVEGIGKGMVIVICRSLLLRQFDRLAIVAIGFYGIVAYATRPTTPFLTSFINESVGWRWVYWVNVPLALLAFPLVLRFVRPDRPAQPRPLPIDWLAISMVAGWAVSMLLTVAWYRKWGGFTSNAFNACVLIDLIVPFLVVVRLGSGLAVDEHLRSMFRVRVYVLAMVTRVLLLIQLLMVLALLAKYCVDAREYPRSVAGSVLVPATFTMATSTFLTTFFRRRGLRHFWLLVGVVGCAASLWWMSSIDGFTSKGRLALMIGCWGLFLGLIPPSFLQDEVEGLNPKDFLYGGPYGGRHPDHRLHLDSVVDDDHHRRMDRSRPGNGAHERAREPSGSSGGFSADCGSLPTARGRWTRTRANDLDGSWELHPVRGRCPRNPARIAIPQPARPRHRAASGGTASVVYKAWSSRLAPSDHS